MTIPIAENHGCGPVPILTTARLILRGHRMADLDARAEIWSDAEGTRYVGGARSRDETEAGIHRYLGLWAHNGRGPFAVEHRGTGRLIGEIGIADMARELGPDFDDAPEALWLLARDTQRRGYALEAMTAVIDWQEARFGCRRLVCLVDPDNAPSLAFAAKLGFRSFAQRRHKDRTVILLERAARTEQAL